MLTPCRACVRCHLGSLPGGRAKRWTYNKPDEKESLPPPRSTGKLAAVHRHLHICSAAGPPGTHQQQQSSQIRLLAPTEAHTRRLAQLLAADIRQGDCICLHGDVGAGKSFFRWAADATMCCCNARVASALCRTLCVPPALHRGDKLLDCAAVVSSSVRHTTNQICRCHHQHTSCRTSTMI